MTTRDHHRSKKTQYIINRSLFEGCPLDVDDAISWIGIDHL